MMEALTDWQAMLITSAFWLAVIVFGSWLEDH